MPKKIPLAVLFETYRQNVYSFPAMLDSLAEELGVSAASLGQIGIG